MQHFVVKDILQKPGWNERLIEQRMNPNHPIFFLDGAENKILFGPLPAFAAPDYPITAQPAAEVPLIHSLENRAQIEMPTFVPKVELTLHRERRPR